MNPDFMQYRHFRFTKNGVRLPSLTFRFEVDFDNMRIKFAVAMCNASDNFSKKTGRTLVDLRFNGGETFEGAYNPEFSLVENAIGILTVAEQDAKNLGELMRNERNSIRGILRAAFSISMHQKVDAEQTAREVWGMLAPFREFWTYVLMDEKQPGLNFPFELHSHYVTEV